MALANCAGIILVTRTTEKQFVKKSADFTRTGNYLDTCITSEHSDINMVLTNFTGIILVTRATKEQSSSNKVLANCMGIILVTHSVILSRAKNL